MSKKKLSFSFHSLLSSSLYISHNFLFSSLFFSSLLLALTHAVLQHCTNPHTLRLHFFSSHLQMTEWPLLFISSSFPSFLPFTLFITSHNKCKPTYLDFASTSFFSSALPLPNDPCLLLLSFRSSFQHVSQV